MPYTTRSTTSGGDTAWMVVIFLLAIVPLTLFNGWVLSVMWNWFVPNIFDNLPQLSIGEAIGLSLVVSAFIYIPFKADDEDPVKSFLKALATPVVRGLLLLAMGAVVHMIVF